ncbi:class I SAM-dependent methyltransferase [Nocardioides astragali]|uniref:Class I SAM-dependent methyltransferase n=1 Tax=Nocardioides astragali TaxID=1776736 RepID=A0ABW2N1C9_9ACTN|nr:class I SAM-dependent methyltransferase [Nocardioides astragali]
MSESQPPQQDVYERNPRQDVAPHIPKHATSALDVGCARGGFDLSLRQALGPRARIVGIEANREAAELAARDSEFDEVLTGYFPHVLEERDVTFDLICFNDVLEHLVDPWTVLRSTHRFLAPDGHVLASIPNVQYAPVVWGLARGRFSYTQTGILDRTHLRFFTRRSMIEMFQSTGFRVVSANGINNITMEYPRLFAGHRRKLRHALGSAQWVQYVVVATSLDVGSQR